uniref:Uncharacterized protein n=1 Tax=Siphoviridae sp. ctLgc23 TaxID=2825455 RepID=A0A8S5QJJ0_9CAUD|nr:MAG TPA: hypothetical protein [Siphoviridae sp. ctLgc23]
MTHSAEYKYNYLNILTHIIYPEWGSCCVWGAVTGFALRAYPWCERGYEPVEYGR